MSNDKIKRADEKSALFSFKQQKQEQWQQVHDLACVNKQDFYIDPQTSYQVMTSYFLKNRGYCCNNNCRHCPYPEEKNKKDSK